MDLLAEKKTNDIPWRYLVEVVVVFLHSAFMRPHLQYTLSSFEPSSATKTRINCNKINRVPPLHGRNLSTCAAKRGCRSWAYSAWRRNGFGGTQQQPARADREITENTNSSLMVAGGKETLSLSWGSDISEILFHWNHSKRVEQVAQKYCAVTILRDLQGQTDQNSQHPEQNSDPGAEAALSQRLN